MSRKRPLWQIPLFILAALFQIISEWSYTVAEWLFEKCDTDIFTASIDWDE